MTGRLRFLPGRTCLLLLAGSPAQVGHSQTLPEQFTAENVMSFIEDNEIGSTAELVEPLPPLHKRHVAFVLKSQALHSEPVSREHPRVVSWGPMPASPFPGPRTPRRPMVSRGPFRSMIRSLTKDSRDLR